MTSRTQVIQVTAPAKIILFGEHSVVYGAPAIAASIDRRTTVELIPRKDHVLQFIFKKLDVNVSFNLPISSPIELPDLNQQQLQAVQCGLLICKNLEKCSTNGAKVTVTSDFPLRAGLGSSASFSVSLSTAFVINECIQNDINLETNSDGTLVISEGLMTQIKDLADKCEHVFHGNPSGIDTSTCSIGGIVRYQRDTGIEKLSNHFPMKIAIVDSKVERQTSAVVQRVKDLRNRLSSPSLQVFSAMKEVSEAAAEEIRSPSKTPEKLLNLVRMNHGLLYALGVSHQVLEKIGIAVADLDVGFKLTGAGAGGNALVFIPPNVLDEHVRTKLSESGFESNIVTVGGPGIEVRLLN